MQTPLDQLINANVFDILGVSPASDVRALRRRLEEVRLQQSMGIAEVSEEQLRDAERAITDPRRLDEFRLTARWASEPALAYVAPAHDEAVTRIAKLRSVSMDDALDCIWPLLRTCGDAPVWQALGRPFGTEEAYGRATVSLGAAALTAALTEPSRFAGAQTIPHLLSATTWPLDELGSAVSAEITASTEAWVAYAAEWRLDNTPSTADSEGAIRAFGLITNEAVEFQKVLAANPERFGNGPGVSAEVAARVKGLARALAIPLFNARRFDDARVVEAGVLLLTHPPADAEELRDALRITDLALARRDVGAAVEREDWPVAETSLERVAVLTTDPEEREQARGMARQVAFRKPAASGAPGIAPGESVMSPIKNAPSLSSWYGIGVRLLGGKSIPGQPGLAISNWYFTLLWIPLCPLRRYVVRPSGQGSWSFIGRVKFRKPEWVHLVAGLGATLIATLIAVAAASNSNNSTEAASGTSEPARTIASSREPVRGDCVSLSGGSSSVSVRVVPCSGPNDGRVLATGRISGTSFPGKLRASTEADRICTSSTRTYISPSPEGWASGDRTMLCLDR